MKAEVWSLARRQHGVVTRGQLLDRGFSAAAITHRIERRRLHPVLRGVYAVGRPELTPRGRWLAAVLSCGPAAALSHRSAAALWGIRAERRSVVDVTVPAGISRGRDGVRVHRRVRLHPALIRRRDRIPVTAPALTLVDLATCLTPDGLESAVNEADRLDLIDPEALRAALDEMPRWRGVAALRRLLDRRTFRLTGSELERGFQPIVRAAGLPEPRTQERVNGFAVDFYWPELGLVVETDGLRYHRTPAHQARDQRRDQAHIASGLTPLRFSHAMVRFEPGRVQAVLIATVEMIRDRLVD